MKTVKIRNTRNFRRILGIIMVLATIVTMAVPFTAPVSAVAPYPANRLQGSTPTRLSAAQRPSNYTAVVDGRSFVFSPYNSGVSTNAFAGAGDFSNVPNDMQALVAYYDFSSSIDTGAAWYQIAIMLSNAAGNTDMVNLGGVNDISWMRVNKDGYAHYAFTSGNYSINAQSSGYIVIPMTKAQLSGIGGVDLSQLGFMLQNTEWAYGGDLANTEGFLGDFGYLTGTSYSEAEAALEAAYTNGFGNYVVVGNNESADKNLTGQGDRSLPSLTGSLSGMPADAEAVVFYYDYSNATGIPQNQTGGTADGKYQVVLDYPNAHWGGSENTIIYNAPLDTNISQYFEYKSGPFGYSKTEHGLSYDGYRPQPQQMGYIVIPSSALKSTTVPLTPSNITGIRFNSMDPGSGANLDGGVLKHRALGYVMDLEQFESDISALMNHDNVISLINSIPSPLSLSDILKIETAREAYDKLSDSVAPYVTNYSALEAAEAAYETLVTFGDIDPYPMGLGSTPTRISPAQRPANYNVVVDGSSFTFTPYGANGVSTSPFTGAGNFSAVPGDIQALVAYYDFSSSTYEGVYPFVKGNINLTNADTSLSAAYNCTWLTVNKNGYSKSVTANSSVETYAQSSGYVIIPMTKAQLQGITNVNLSQLGLIFTNSDWGMGGALANTEAFFGDFGYITGTDFATALEPLQDVYSSNLGNYVVTGANENADTASRTVLPTVTGSFSGIPSGAEAIAFYYDYSNMNGTNGTYTQHYESHGMFRIFVRTTSGDTRIIDKWTNPYLPEFTVNKYTTGPYGYSVEENFYYWDGYQPNPKETGYIVIPISNLTASGIDVEDITMIWFESVEWGWGGNLDGVTVSHRALGYIMDMNQFASDFADTMNYQNAVNLINAVPETVSPAGAAALNAARTAYDKLSYAVTPLVTNYLDLIYLEAVYDSASYNVTFNAGLGAFSSGKTIVQSILVGPEGKAQAPNPSPVYEGYTCVGWYTESGCTNKWDFDTLISSDITLYAKWTVCGDIDFDGEITEDDITLVAEYLLKKPSAVSYIEGDEEVFKAVCLTGTEITILDLLTIKELYNNRDTFDVGFGFYHLEPTHADFASMTAHSTGNKLNVSIIGDQNIAPNLQKAAENGTKVWVNIQSVYEALINIGSWGAGDLWIDWFNQIESRIVGSGYASACLGFYLDEPNAMQTLKQVSKYNTDNFGRRFFVNFRTNEVSPSGSRNENSHITVNNTQYLTDVSFNMYADFSTTSNKNTFNNHRNNIKTYCTNENVKYWYTPETKGVKTWSNPQASAVSTRAARCITSLNFMYEKLQEDYAQGKAGGLMCFTYDFTGGSGDDSYGLKLVNENLSNAFSGVLAKAQEIGYDICQGTIIK